MSGAPPKFPMIWTLFKPSIFFAPFSSSYAAHRPVGIHGSPRAFGAARLLRLALRAERPRVKQKWQPMPLRRGPALRFLRCPPAHGPAARSTPEAPSPGFEAHTGWASARKGGEGG